MSEAPSGNFLLFGSKKSVTATSQNITVTKLHINVKQNKIMVMSFSVQKAKVSAETVFTLFSTIAGEQESRLCLYHIITLTGP